MNKTVEQVFVFRTFEIPTIIPGLRHRRYFLRINTFCIVQVVGTAIAQLRLCMRFAFTNTDRRRASRAGAAFAHGRVRQFIPVNAFSFAAYPVEISHVSRRRAGATSRQAKLWRSEFGTTRNRSVTLRSHIALLVIQCLIGVSGAGWLSAAPMEDDASVLKGLHAPASSERPWPTPDLRSFAGVQTGRREPTVEAQKDYELAELIDLAEQINPQTKVAWERAKEAASAVGLARSQYYPFLAMQAAAGTARTPEPVPLTLDKGAFMDVKEQQATPVAELDWILLDFGRRKADVNAAKHQLLAANLGFNAHHQEIVFKVQSAFYELSKARGRIDVAQSALDSAIKVQQAAEERFKQGLATAPDVSQARQQEAQAAFDLEAVQVEERDAQVNLAEAIGILPTTPLRVVDFSRLPIPTNLESSVETFIDRSLVQRPDLLAKVAILRQKEAEIRKARSAYYPALAFQGGAGASLDRAQMGVEGSRQPWTSAEQANWNVGLSLTWQLFDGGARRRKLEMARAERHAAQHDLDDARDKAISQVWLYYSDTKLAIRRLDVAAALLEASQKSYDQTFESYRNGLSSLVDLLAANRALSQAKFTQLDTRATVLESTAALAMMSRPIVLARILGSTLNGVGEIFSSDIILTPEKQQPGSQRDQRPETKIDQETRLQIGFDADLDESLA